MKRFSTNTTAMPSGPVGKAFEEVSASFERFCLAAGVDTLSAMLEKDAEEVCGPRHVRGGGRRGHRWGRTRGKIGFHGGADVSCGSKSEVLNRPGLNLTDALPSQIVVVCYFLDKRFRNEHP